MSVAVAFVHWGYLEQFMVSILLFFTWVLCIYIILDKGCHILYVFLYGKQPQNRPAFV